MTQNRNLLPLTVYLPPELLAKIEKRAQSNMAATAAQARADLASVYRAVK